MNEPFFLFRYLIIGLIKLINRYKEDDTNSNINIDEVGIRHGKDVVFK